jgi:hypothetical protein
VRIPARCSLSNDIGTMSALPGDDMPYASAIASFTNAVRSVNNAETEPCSQYA